jgi:uncharacterized protein YwgA
MELNQLTDEQIANLTPEQIEMLENDPVKVSEILGKESDQAQETATDKPEQEVDGAANGAASGAANGAANDAGEEEEPVVLNKSGKGIIPYQKHKELRVENSTLRQQLQEAQNKLDELRQVKDEAVGKKDVAAADDAISKHLENLKAEMPELHSVINAVLEGSRKQGEKLEQTLAELKREKEESERVKQLSVAEQVAEAKDNNPDLVHWEANDPEAWDEAQRQDEILRQNAKWANKPYAERFEEVARRVRAIMPDASGTKRTESAEEMKSKAKAKVESAPARKPITLSDIQGGANPTSEAEQLASLSPAELAAKLMTMPAHRQAAMRAELIKD